MAATALRFTPLLGLAGGAVLGIAAAGKYIITGRILGISGAVKGLLTGDFSGWRLAFNGGLLAGGVAAGLLAPAAFDVLPATFTVGRAALGGLLVGVGAALGNGCTSGHGICGNARLSPRSFAYTLTFMAAGAAAAALTGAAAAAGVPAAAATLALGSWEAAKAGAALVGGAALAFSWLAAAGDRAATPEGRRGVELVTEAAAGVFFAAGLAFSGMVRPSKVAAFLSPAAKGFDPSLAFVMGGALAVALPAFQLARREGGAKPICEPAFADPPSRPIDAKLIAGGVLFGAGWGVSGMCPGPALVALVATRAPQVAAYCGAMALGLAAEAAAARARAKRPGGGKKAA